MYFLLIAVIVLWLICADDWIQPKPCENDSQIKERDQEMAILKVLYMYAVLLTNADICVTCLFYVYSHYT